MITFKIVNNDIVFDGQNNIAMVSGRDERAQSIERILTTNIREWFLNILHGLDYDKIQGKGKDREGIRLAITEAIYQDDRVSNVEYVNIEIDRLKRHLDVRFKIEMVYGEILEGGEVIEFG